MKSRIVFLTVFLATSGFAAERWWPPDKVYSIVPPSDWKHGTSKGDAGSSYSFTAPDGKSEVRISAAYHISLPETMPDDVLGTAFPKEHSVTPITAIRGAGWDGLQCEYIDDTGSTRWLGVAARHGSTVVLLTMKTSAKEFEHLRPTFQSVGQSISFSQ